MSWATLSRRVRATSAVRLLLGLTLLLTSVMPVPLTSAAVPAGAVLVTRHDTMMWIATPESPNDFTTSEYRFDTPEIGVDIPAETFELPYEIGESP